MRSIQVSYKRRLSVQTSFFVHVVVAFRLFKLVDSSSNYVAGHSVVTFIATLAVEVIRLGYELRVTSICRELLQDICIKGYKVGVELL